MTRRFAPALMCASSVFCVVAAAGAADEPAKHTIAIDGLAYQPDALVVNRGDTVVWVNKDPFPHTVTAAGTFDSREIPAGGSWTYVAQKSGSYLYVCTLHPTMKAALTVE